MKGNVPPHRPVRILLTRQEYEDWGVEESGKWRIVWQDHARDILEVERIEEDDEYKARTDQT